MRIATSMRSPRHALLAVTVVVAALTAWTATARAVGEEVTITPLGGSPVTVALDDPELRRDVDTYYEVRSPGKPLQRVFVNDGATLQNLLDAAGLGDDGIEYVELQRPASSGGGALRVNVDQGDGREPAVYVDEQGVLRFIRQSSGARDFNAGDWLAFEDGRISIAEVDAGLRVAIEASTTRPKVGEQVQFEATVLGGGAGDAFTFEWFFENGGRRPQSQTPTYTFRKAGTYPVAVTATARDAEYVRDELDIRVGKEPKFEPPKDDGEGGTGTDPAGTPSPGTTTPDPTSGASTDPGYTPPADSTSSPTPPLDFQPATGTGLTVDDGTVEGYLLADASSPPSSATLDAIEAARDGFVEEDDPGPIPTAVWALLGTVMLVTAGAALESRPTRPRTTVARVARMRGGALRNLLPRKRS